MPLPESKGQIIITTHNERDTTLRTLGDQRTVSIDPWNGETGSDFILTLLKYTDSVEVLQVDQNSAKKLSEQLEGYPYLLSAMVKGMVDLQMDITRFTEVLATREIRSHYSPGIKRWVEKITPQARTIMAILSFCNDRGIPETLLNLIKNAKTMAELNIFSQTRM